MQQTSTLRRSGRAKPPIPIVNGSELRVMLYRWDADGAGVSEHGTPVELLKEAEPFAKGECRDAFRVKCTADIFDGESWPYVLKLSRPARYAMINEERYKLDSDTTKAAHEAEVISTMLSRGFADEWNKKLDAAHLDYKRIRVVPAALVQLGEHVFGTIEPLVEEFLPPGAFVHYNSPFGEEENSDDLEVKETPQVRERRETLAAFSHFTMTCSPTFVGADKFGLGADKQVVLDLQGTHTQSKIILTDLQVCRRRGQQLGTPFMEIRHAGFGGFCQHHKCNAVCKRLMKAELMGQLPPGQPREVDAPDIDANPYWVLD